MTYHHVIPFWPTRWDIESIQSALNPPKESWRTWICILQSVFYFAYRLKHLIGWLMADFYASAGDWSGHGQKEDSNIHKVKLRNQTISYFHYRKVQHTKKRPLMLCPHTLFNNPLVWLLSCKVESTFKLDVYAKVYHDVFTQNGRQTLILI